MTGVAWWVPWALAFCAATFTAAAGVLLVLAVRGVWHLVAAYRREPAHAGGPAAERLWPLVGDPRAGSMQLADDLAWPGLVVAHEEDWLAQTRAALAPAVLADRAAYGVPGWALDPGPGEREADVTSSAPPGPEWLRGPEQPHEKPAGTESAGSGHTEPEPVRVVAGDHLGPRALAVLARYERSLGGRRWALA